MVVAGGEVDEKGQSKGWNITKSQLRATLGGTCDWLAWSAPVAEDLSVAGGAPTRRCGPTSPTAKTITPTRIGATSPIRITPNRSETAPPAGPSLILHFVNYRNEV